MLKLTYSFYRYLTVTCERVDYKAHVRKYSYLSGIREICRVSCLDVTLKRQFNCHTVSLKQDKPKKRLQVKIPPLGLNELEGAEQMSKPAYPAISLATDHVCYGGTFTVSSDDEDSAPAPSNFKKNIKSSSNTEKPQQIPLNFRCWESLRSKKYLKNATTFKFKVVSYNVLAQYLLESHPYLYTECSGRDLKWNVRSARLFEEIQVLAPDVLCLQEVQKSHLESFYAQFEQIGYSGVFKQKTGQRQDGCAIYFKKSLFELKDHISVEFCQPGFSLLNRDNVGIMVKLAPRCDSYSPVVVATTHLLYNPKRTDVRLAQMQLFLAEIDRFAFYRDGNDCGHLPIVLTGDFNSTPDSAVIKLLDHGYVSAGTLRENVNWEQIGITDNCQHLSVYLDRRAGRETTFNNLQIYHSDYSDVISVVARAPGPFSQLFNGGEIWHTLQLASIYDKYKANGINEASTYQDGWVTVDYIYYNGVSNIHLSDRLRLPSAEECKSLHRLPNEVFGSDHLALAAVFHLTPSYVKATL